MYNSKDENLIRLTKKIKENPQSFIFILGAGMSIPGGLPSWNKLLEGMIDYYEQYCKEMEADCDGEVAELRKMDDKWRAFSKLKEQLPDTEYRKYISTSLSVEGKSIPEAYELIWKLDIGGVVTFNIDKFIINAYAKIKQSAVDFATRKESVKYNYFLSGDNKFVFFPHGEISDCSSWVFTDQERRTTYNDKGFQKMMTTLLNGKNLVIMGFNPQENNFLTLLNDIAIEGAIAGYDNYYIGDNLTKDDCKHLGEYGISCISYKPETEFHPEIVEILNGINKYIPKDVEYPSVYKGKEYTEEDIPVFAECLQMGVNKLREILNGNIANIMPPDTVPTQEQIQRLQVFYQKYAPQMHIAWYVDPKKEEGNQIHGYRLKSAIGRGAFGNVYEAYDEENNKYALKILLPEVKDKVQYLSCFRRGIRSMNILKENHVDGMVKIYSSYEVPACIIMDYVEGITLREAIEKNYLKSLNKKLEVILSIASIIHKAHGLKECILHRDLKPENVMLQDFYYENSEDSIQVIILDFDLSWHKGATELTVALGAMSQGFMAPEQVEENEIYKRNTAVDVYSIGMLAYFVLTRKNPAPYQHRFHCFEEELKDSIYTGHKTQWKCLPAFLADTIKRATLQNPTERISLEGFIYNMQAALDMVISNEISSSHPLFLRELAYQIDESGEVEICDFGRKLELNQPALGKSVKLELRQEGRDIVILVQINKVRKGYDKRKPIYLENSKNKALALADREIFDRREGNVELSAVNIVLTAKLQTVLKYEWICKMAQNIQNIRAKLELQ